MERVLNRRPGCGRLRPTDESVLWTRWRDVVPLVTSVVPLGIVPLGIVPLGIAIDWLPMPSGTIRRVRRVVGGARVR